MKHFLPASNLDSCASFNTIRALAAPLYPYAAFNYSNNLVNTHISQTNDAAHSCARAKQMWTVVRSDFLAIFSFSISGIHSRACWLVLTFQKIIQDQSAESAATMFRVILSLMCKQAMVIIIITSTVPIILIITTCSWFMTSLSIHICTDCTVRVHSCAWSSDWDLWPGTCCTGFPHVHCMSLHKWMGPL